MKGRIAEPDTGKTQQHEKGRYKREVLRIPADNQIWWKVLVLNRAG